MHNTYPTLHLYLCICTTDVFESDADLLTLRAHVTDEFSTAFSGGLAAYLRGDWAGARPQLERADRLMREAAPALGGDGPSLTLLRHMADHCWAAPADWAGYRPLLAK